MAAGGSAAALHTHHRLFNENTGLLPEYNQIYPHGQAKTLIPYFVVMQLWAAYSRHGLDANGQLLLLTSVYYHGMPSS